MSRAEMHRFGTLGQSALVSLLLLALAMPLAAQQHPNREGGFTPDRVHQFGDLDSVNLFNGNLVVRIPVGNAYAVDGALSYSLTLYATGKLWDVRERCTTPARDTEEEECYTLVTPAGELAGLGWTLSLGKIFAPLTGGNRSETMWLYESPDGSDHLFYPTLHEGDGNESPAVSYSRDGTYLRMIDSGAGYREIEFPDRSIHRFGSSDGKLQQIRDIFGNHLNVTYPDSLTIQLSDQHLRNHYLRFSETTRGPRLSQADLQSFGGGRAAYDFQYLEQSISRPCLDDDPATGATVTVSLLTKILPPADVSGAREEFVISSYNSGDSGQACSTTIAPNLDTTHLMSGRFGELKLPTLGALRYTWSAWTLPSELQAGQETKVAGVSSRAFINASGASTGAWTYTTELDGLVPHREMKNTVTDPLGAKSENYFSVYQGEPSGGWNRADYALPFTRNATDGTTPGRFLSTRAWSAAGSLLRSSWVRYEYDAATCLPETSCNRERNRRVVSQRNIFHDDGGRYADVNHSSFDGLGHYRQSVTAGTFDSGNVRTSFTNYNPGVGTYSLNSDGTRAPGYTMLASNARWLINTYPDAWTEEAGVRAYQSFCFDSWDGFLLGTRSMAGATAQTNDLVTLFSKSTAGNVAAEASFGGDNGSAAPSNLCSFASGGQYQVNHTYRYGSLESSQFSGVTFKSADRTLDPSTGLVTSSRDPSGISTSFEYDARGRLLWSKPQSGHGAWVQYVYTRATGPDSGLAKVDVTERPNGSTSGVLGARSIQFNPFGRVRLEKTQMPDGTWSQRETRYHHALGWRSQVSEMQTQGTAPFWTTFGNYDPFGRLGTMTPPDGSAHAVSLAYAGARQTSRTVSITTAVNSETSATVTETYDRQGRLASVSEPSRPDGTAQLTTYTYNVHNKLASVSATNEVGVSQTRSFTWDGRGLLTSELHPERGTTFYSYDSRGQVTRSRTGAEGGQFDVRYTYDAAGRLVSVSDYGTSRTLKSFTYASENNSGEWGKGKLREAKRNNYTPSLGTIVATETYTYAGAGGRASQRATSLSNGPSFSQTFSYNDLGNPSAISYPSCTHSPCNGAPGPSRGVVPSYSYGSTTAVPGYASAITYHPNGLLSSISHANGVKTIQENDPWSMPRPGHLMFTGAIQDPVLPLGDFNADGKADIFYRNRKTSEAEVWLMNGASVTGGANLGTIPHAWRPVGIRDFSGDAKADVVWLSSGTGSTALWFMDGLRLTGFKWVGTMSDLGWRVPAVDDFNGDGKADVLWHRVNTGDVWMWLMHGSDGTTIGTQHWIHAVDPAWEIQLAADFDGDGKADILLRDRNDGRNWMWKMDGKEIVTSGLQETLPLSWKPVGLSDFDRNGKKDIVWWNSATGEVRIWLMTGLLTKSDVYVTTQSDVSWTPGGVGDMDGNGTADILWWHSPSGSEYVTLLNGTSVMTQTWIGGTSADREIVGRAGSGTWTLGKYTWDGAGNVAKIGFDYFTYDKVSRLVRSTADGNQGNDYNQTYTYDVFGNIRKITDAQGGVKNITVSGSTNRITDGGFEYDAAGNQTRWEWSYTAGYDGLSMMSTHANPQRSFTYVYTADDERIAAYDGYQWSWKIRDLGGKVLREYNQIASTNAWSWKKDYIYRDGALLASVDASGTRHMHLDHLGTPRLITGQFRADAVHHHYYGFGREASPMTRDSEVLKFTGHERDFNGGNTSENLEYLDYMHARYYNPNLGRFLSVDPVLDIERAMRKPQAWNRYTYVDNNPINKVDPDGRETRSAIALEHDIQAVMGGDISRAEYMERLQARGEGALLGIGTVTGGLGIRAAGMFLMRNPQILLAAMGWGNATVGGPAPVRVGQAGEALAGISGDKVRIAIDGRIRIPDSLTTVTLTEVKNVLNLSNRSQLRDFLKFSQETGREFVLVVRENTKLSKPLQTLVDDGLIKLERVLPK